MRLYRKRLRKKGVLEEYNDAMEEFLNHAVLREILKEEMAEWAGQFNYIVHQEVFKAKSATTKLRVVSSSSLSNSNSGWSYNAIMPKGPNFIVLLLSAVISWRSYENTIM